MLSQRRGVLVDRLTLHEKTRGRELTDAELLENSHQQFLRRTQFTETELAGIVVISTSIDQISDQDPRRGAAASVHHNADGAY